MNDRYLDPYRRWAKQFGTDVGVTLWASPRSQTLRFEVMAEMVDFSGHRILDAGCSRGDFAEFLDEKGVAYEKFIGVDGLDDVIAYARTRGLPRAEFHTGDLIADPELMRIGDPTIIAISGTLNTMTMKQALCLLDHAWAAKPEVLIYNFLPDLARRGAPPQTGPARRLSACRLLTWSAEQTGRVVYRQDYFDQGHDATILMRPETRTYLPS